MRKIKTLLILISILFLFSSCDDINQIMSLIPKFDTSLPNVISGKYAYYEEDDDIGYTELLTFNPADLTFEYEVVGSGKWKGTYTYEYKDFNITIGNGFITLIYEDGTKEKYGFLYEATAVEGPTSLTLNRNNETKVYKYKGK